LLCSRCIPRRRDYRTVGHALCVQVHITPCPHRCHCSIHQHQLKTSQERNRCHCATLGLASSQPRHHCSPALAIQPCCALRCESIALAAFAALVRTLIISSVTSKQVQNTSQPRSSRNSPPLPLAQLTLSLYAGASQRPYMLHTISITAQQHRGAAAAHPLAHPRSSIATSRLALRAEIPSFFVLPQYRRHAVTSSRVSHAGAPITASAAAAHAQLTFSTASQQPQHLALRVDLVRGAARVTHTPAVLQPSHAIAHLGIHTRTARTRTY
jgi:hypothetical protein